MGKKKTLNDFEKGQITAFKDAGLSHREIASRLTRSPKVINNFIKLGINYGARKSSGRPPLLTLRDKRAVLKHVSNNCVSISEVKAKLNIPASKETIRRVIHQNPHIKFLKMKAKPVLTKLHKQVRLGWAKDHMSWTKEWNNVVFTDEKKWNLDGPDGFHYYWHDLRKEQKTLSKRQSGGGSVIIWGGFGKRGKTPVVFLTGNQTSADYIEVLQNHLIPFGRRIGGQRWTLQQDNASIHSSRITKEWFASQSLRVLSWPSKSPDLNPIENLWGMLSRMVYANGKQYSNVGELRQSIQLAWDELDKERLGKLVDSMPNRVYEVISKGGGCTNY